MKKTDCFGRQNKLFCFTKQSVFCCYSLHLMIIIRAHNHENLRYLRNWRDHFSHKLLLFKNRFACIIFLKNALANDAYNADDVPSYSMRYRDEGTSLLFEQRTKEIKHHREGNDYLFCGKKVAQICCK